MKRKLIAIILLSVILLSCICTSVFGHEEYADVNSLDYEKTLKLNIQVASEDIEKTTEIKWEFNNSTLYIYQDMSDYSSSNPAPWTEYKDKIKNVVIADGVTTISSYAFYDCNNLISMEIPETIKNIGEYTFYNCYNLSNVVIPANLNYIGANAFYGCKGLTSITIPGGIKRILSYTFSGCSGLKEVTIQQGVNSIEYGAFAICTNLERIVIPESVYEIESYAFSYTNLTEVEIPSSTTYVEGDAFYGCELLENINVSEDNYKYSSIDGNLLDKNGTTLIMYAPGKTSSSYTMPDSVTSIYSYAFAFSRLENIYVSENNMTYSSIHGVLFNKDHTKLLQYPSHKVGELYDIPDTVTIVSNYAFFNCTKLVNIKIPESVEKIGSYAFGYCTGLRHLEIPQAKEIGNDAFVGCENLESISLPDGMEYIDGSVFMDCDNLTNVKIPEGVNIIYPYAFMDCDKLSSVSIPSTTTEIRLRAFIDCDFIDTVYYNGTPEQWNRITIGISNDSINNADKYYNCKYASDDIYIMQDDKTTVHAKPQEQFKGDTVIVAFYDDDVLVDSYSAVYDGSRIECYTTKKNDEIKIMIWNSIESMIPSCVPQIISSETWEKI